MQLTASLQQGGIQISTLAEAAMRVMVRKSEESRSSIISPRHVKAAESWYYGDTAKGTNHFSPETKQIAFGTWWFLQPHNLFSVFRNRWSVTMLAEVHTSDCCCGGKGVDRHRDFAKQFLGKEMWQTDQINPTEIMHPPKSMVPSCPNTLSLFLWLFYFQWECKSPSGLVWEVCAGHIPVSTYGCHTQIRHFTPAWFGETPSAFHTSSSLASPFPPKPPFSRTPWGENIEKGPVAICSSREGLRMASKQSWDILWPGWTGQTEGAGKVL